MNIMNGTKHWLKQFRMHDTEALILERTKSSQRLLSVTFVFVLLRNNELQNFLQSSCSNRKFQHAVICLQKCISFLQKTEVIGGKGIFVKTISCHENYFIFFFFVGSIFVVMVSNIPFIIAIIYVLGLAMSARCFIKCLVTNQYKKACLIL